MTRRLRALDRALTALVGLLLLAAALLTLAWTRGWTLGGTLHLPHDVHTGPVTDTLRAGWWPWTFAIVTVVLGLLALRWLLAHVPTPSRRALRTVNADDAGATRLDLTALAEATGSRFADLAPVVAARGSYRQVRGEHVVEVRAAVDDRTSSRLVAEAVRTIDAELQAAFEDGHAHLRVLLGAPARLSSFTARSTSTGTLVNATRTD